jgi:hypothetical protein
MLAARLIEERELNNGIAEHAMSLYAKQGGGVVMCSMNWPSLPKVFLAIVGPPCSQGGGPPHASFAFTRKAIDQFPSGEFRKYVERMTAELIRREAGVPGELDRDLTLNKRDNNSTSN